MNTENLVKMAEFILTIPQEKFDMSFYRYDKEEEPNYSIPECNSIGCVIGHCTILDPNIINYFDEEGEIDFTSWSQNFTEIYWHTHTWEYLFSAIWVDYDNTPQGASKRIMDVVNGLNVTSEHLPWMR